MFRYPLDMWPRWCALKWCGISSQAYTEGFRVYTTILSKNQQIAVQALRDDLLAYTERHGYRGMITHYTLISKRQDQSENQIMRSAGGAKCYF